MLLRSSSDIAVSAPQIQQPKRSTLWRDTQIELAMSLLRDIADAEQQDVNENELAARALLHLQQGRQQILESAHAAAAAMVAREKLCETRVKR